MNKSFRISVCWSVCAAFVLCTLATSSVIGQQTDVVEHARRLMVQNEVVRRGIRDLRVIEAMREVPRHLYVPANQRKYAYQDAALPLGHGQTITSPFVVAFMTEKLEPLPSDKVLEIGTGSGYQASILSRLVAEVYSIEIVEPLARRAARTIRELGYDNVHTKIGDGYQGWPEHAPFDKIIVTCSPEKVPPALVSQLQEGGRLVIPLGGRFQQTLFLFRKVDGQLQQEPLEATFFVPMTGEAEALRVRKSDSGVPDIVNGDFEQPAVDDNLPGWFYVRQATVVRQSTGNAGQSVLFLSNQSVGQNCHALQAFGVDGRVVNNIELSARTRTRGVSAGGIKDALPRIELTFYDENRGVIRRVGLGPWEGDTSWSLQSIRIPVPGRARLGTVLIGMFGATGEFMVDDLSVRRTADAR